LPIDDCQTTPSCTWLKLVDDWRSPEVYESAIYVIGLWEEWKAKLSSPGGQGSAPSVSEQHAPTHKLGDWDKPVPKWEFNVLLESFFPWHESKRQRLALDTKVWEAAIEKAFMRSGEKGT
jgi:hypothetical protein